MKRILVLLLALCLIFSCFAGCRKKNKNNQADNGSNTTESSTNTTENETEETYDDVVHVENDGVTYRHPLNGTPLDAPWSGQIVAVMTNNIKKSMPQHGLSQADVVYEMEEEGGITRNMALFSDISKVGPIGSIRSTRTYFVSVAAAFDAYLVHCGTSNHASGGGYNDNGNKVSGWKDLDEQSKYGQYFYRDKDRLNAGYGWEHTLFTSGEKLKNALEGKSLSKPTDSKGLTFGLQFKNQVDLNGAKAEDITITFKGSRTTGFVYDAATGLYKRIQHGVDSIDGNTNATVCFKNVIALYTKQWGCNCYSDNHQFYDTIGKGEGYVAINGEIVPIKWSRKDVNSPYVYTLADGSPLVLEVGTTYVAFVGIKNPIVYK